MPKKLLLPFLLLLLAALSLGLYFQLSGSSLNLQSSSLTAPRSYFTSERPIHAIFLTQKDTKLPTLNRQNLSHAILTLFTNLKKNQQAIQTANSSFTGYDNIVVIFDPAYPASEPDPFQEQATFAFPNAQYQAIHPTTSEREAALTEKISSSAPSPNTLYILHSYLNFTDSDPVIWQLQKEHYKDVFDNLNKAALDTLAFTNSEAAKVVYQFAKEAGALKSLPTLEDETNQYQIKFLAEGSQPPTDNINLTFIGDIMLDRDVRARMNKYGMDHPFEKMNDSYLQMNDLLIANLEGPVAEKAVETTKSIAFRFLPDVVDLLKKYHFDALSQANNHTFDMGAAGLADTYRLLSASNLTPFGHPRDLTDDRSAALFNLHGHRIALLGLNNTDFKLTKSNVVTKIKSLTEQGYQVIPFIHWGTEYVHTPSNEQVDLAHSFVDAGAIAVIGMHPHVVQSFEIYNNSPIFYSLGNAIFDQYFSPDTQEGLTVNLRLTKTETIITLAPIKIDHTQFRLMTPDEKTAFLRKFSEWWRYDQETKDQILKGQIVIKHPAL